MMAGLDRFRLYFLLMDIATVLTVIGLALTLLDPASLFKQEAESTGALVFGMIAFLLPTFLMFARFMRDEFAESCWQRAAATTVKGMFVVPFIALFTSVVVAGYRDGASRADGVVATAPQMPLDQISGTLMLAWGWTLMTMLFVLAFQWHRWRGLR